MATTKTNSLVFLVLFLMMSTFSSSARARPLRTFDKEAKECFEGFIDGLAIWGVKTAGQNPEARGMGSQPLIHWEGSRTAVRPLV
ncbi:hypothetical protein QJS10_CPA02g00332 [Acorus calamus]|uniref:Uncharacterized protein n=1 Tax=Acorus calamus TaxID=4465 RepID=A0AAV9FAM1_ACOCL|nr:hypothetical protein QJS10_CPA02g00332 [Acorus calamus]